MPTLRQLIVESYTEDETHFYGFADRGNGSGVGEPGRLRRMDTDEERAAYLDIELAPCPPIQAEGEPVEFVYTSEWIDGGNGYEYRVMF